MAARLPCIVPGNRLKFHAASNACNRRSPMFQAFEYLIPGSTTILHLSFLMRHQ